MAGREPSDIYMDAAVLAQSSDPYDLARAYRLFASIPDYLDAAQRAASLKIYGDKYAELEKANIKKVQEKKSKGRRQITTLVVVLLVIAGLVGGAFGLQWKVRTDYEKAQALIREGEYREAEKLLQFLFSYKESEALREHAQQYLNYFDALKGELEAGGLSPARSTEIYDQLGMMEGFSEAEALRQQFTRKQLGYTKTASDGQVTVYRHGFDENGQVIVITALQVEDGEEKTVHTETVYRDPQEGQVTSEFSYTAKKLSDSTVLKKFTNSDGEYIVEEETTYHDDPTKHYFYRWFNEDGNQVYGPTEDFSFPKTGSKKTVLVFYRHLDAQGRVVRSWQQEVTKKGKVDSEKQKEVVYSYDEAGQLVLETHYKTTEKKNKVDYTVTYTYDDKGRITEMVKDDAVTVYTYNEFGELAETVRTKDKKDTRQVYSYGYIYGPDGAQ